MRPGLNLILGGNGSGKTSMMEAIYAWLLSCSPHGNEYAEDYFLPKDIRLGTKATQVEGELVIANKSYKHTARKSTTDKVTFRGKTPSKVPVLYLPFERDFPNDAGLWLESHPNSLAHINSCLTDFYISWKSFAVSNGQLMLFYDDRGTLGARRAPQDLSSAEKSVFTMLYSITRKLAESYIPYRPRLKDRSAVVLLDTIEMHLDIETMRNVVRCLLGAFPCCQFIIATHSPEVVSGWWNNHTHTIQDGIVMPPDRTYGFDAKSITEYIEHAKPSESALQQMFKSIYQYLDADECNMKDSMFLMDALAKRLRTEDYDAFCVEPTVLTDWVK